MLSLSFFLPFSLFTVLVKIMLMVYAPPHFKVFPLINHHRFINCCCNSNSIHGYGAMDTHNTYVAQHVANICIHVHFIKSFFLSFLQHELYIATKYRNYTIPMQLELTQSYNLILTFPIQNTFIFVKDILEIQIQSDLKVYD